MCAAPPPLCGEREVPLAAERHAGQRHVRCRQPPLVLCRAKALAGIAKALASNTAVSHPEIFVMTQCPPPFRPAPQCIYSNCERLCSFAETDADRADVIDHEHFARFRSAAKCSIAQSDTCAEAGAMSKSFAAYQRAASANPAAGSRCCERRCGSDARERALRGVTRLLRGCRPGARSVRRSDRNPPAGRAFICAFLTAARVPEPTLPSTSPTPS